MNIKHKVKIAALTGLAALITTIPFAFMRRENPNTRYFWGHTPYTKMDDKYSRMSCRAEGFGCKWNNYLHR